MKIELKHLNKNYKNVTALKDVNTVINPGDVISVIGPSGAGKSTLLRCINMLERPTGGQILIDGTDITARGYDLTQARRRMGMVFQSFQLFSHLTVIENLMLAPMDILKKSRKEAFENGVSLLKRVGLSGREYQYPDQLSGGQQQRVAIARTLAMDPELILLDEPTSALDPAMVSEVQTVIRDLSGSGKTMMIVTHEMNFARAICNRVFYVDQGGICEDGPPEQVFDHPKEELTRRFLHKLKVLEIPIDDPDYDFPATYARIDQWCMKNEISTILKNHIQHVYEELISQLLLPALKDPDMMVLLEYSDAKKTAVIQVLYNGPFFSPADSENRLSYTLLEKTAGEMRHDKITEGSFTNRFRCTIPE